MIDRDRYEPGTPLSMDLPEGSRARARTTCPASATSRFGPAGSGAPAENRRVKSPRTLFRLYEASVGRNCTLLLNVPPDDRGLIHDNDVKALAGMRALVDRIVRHVARPRRRIGDGEQHARRRPASTPPVCSTTTSTRTGRRRPVTQDSAR